MLKEIVRAASIGLARPAWAADGEGFNLSDAVRLRYKAATACSSLNLTASF